MKNMYGSSHFNIYSSLIIYKQSINVDIIILKLFIVLLFNNIYIVLRSLKPNVVIVVVANINRVNILDIIWNRQFRYCAGVIIEC